MNNISEFYANFGEIYDASLPQFRGWCEERDLKVNETRLDRHPIVSGDEIAFLWIYAQLEVALKNSIVMARVMVVPSRFLESFDPEDRDKVHHMIFSTFEGSESDRELYLPVLCTDNRPDLFLGSVLGELTVAECIFCVTPDGVASEASAILSQELILNQDAE